jgi:hypothetical protein
VNRSPRSSGFPADQSDFPGRQADVQTLFAVAMTAYGAPRYLEKKRHSQTLLKRLGRSHLLLKPGEEGCCENTAVE